MSRSIAVLQALNRLGSLSLMQLAREVDLPYPTTCRIMNTLIFEGLVECESTRKYYRVTALVRSLATGFQVKDRLVSLARPHLDAFTRKHYWPLAISTHVGHMMVVSDSTNADTSMTFTNFQPGYCFPMLESACGHAYLGFCGDAERATILKGIEAHDGRSLVLSMFESGKMTQRIQEDGYAVYARTPHTPTPGKTSSIAVPLFDDGVQIAALTMTIFTSAMSIEEAVKRYIADLQLAATHIGDEMRAANVDDPRAAPLLARKQHSQGAVH